MMLQNRPIALSFIAAAWFYQGLQAVIGMIGAISMGKISIDLTVVLIPVGIGLLQLSDGWRKFSIFVVGLAAVVVAALVGYEIFRPGQMAVTWFGTQTQGAPRYILFTALVGIAGFLIWWAFKTLTRPEIAGLFKAAESPPPATP